MRIRYLRGMLRQRHDLLVDQILLLYEGVILRPYHDNFPLVLLRVLPKPIRGSFGCPEIWLHLLITVAKLLIIDLEPRD